MRKKCLINERGAMGIGTILMGFFFLFFLLMPLYFFIFEQYYFSMTANICAGTLDNTLEQLEFSLMTTELSSTRRQLREDEMLSVLSQKMSETTEAKIDYLKVLTSYDQGKPIVEVKLAMSYPAKTIAGKYFENNGRITMVFDRHREIPYDR